MEETRARDARLRRMKWWATGLLALAGVIYVAAQAYQPRYPWLYYVGITAEAAMVGAIADWFAVTALFHHPFGLRFIPHTAIIPRNNILVRDDKSYPYLMVSVHQCPRLGFHRGAKDKRQRYFGPFQHAYAV